jgi:Tfp pilus assembly protein PilF
MAALALAALLLCQAAREDWKQRGLSLAMGGQLEAAAAALSKACERSPRNDDACYYLGRTWFTLGRYMEARESFAKALQRSPKPMLSKAHRAAALNFVALIIPEEAERHFRKAIQLSHGTKSSDEDPRVDYAAFLFRQGRMEEALPILEQAIKEQPGSARAHTELGRVLLHMGKRELAAARLEKAVALDPGSTAARLLLGRTYLELDRKEQGEQQLRLGQENWNQRYGSSTVK